MLFFIIMISTLTSCENKTDGVSDGIIIDKSDFSKKMGINTQAIVKTVSDSIDYNNKRYKVVLVPFSDEFSYDKGVYNAVFYFCKFENKKYKTIFKDSIQSHFYGIEFKDFNNDSVEDVLIGNISDVRSNSTYYLYLFNPNNDNLKKVKGFETIKNPRYLNEFNLIDNEVASGRYWTSFYEIKKDSVIDFGYVIYRGIEREGDFDTYDKNYSKALNEIIKKKN